MGGRKNNNNKNKNNNNKKKRAEKQRQQQQKQERQDDKNNQKSNDNDSNFVIEAGPGCYIARRRKDDVMESNAATDNYSPSSCSSWMLGWEDITKDDEIFEYDKDDIPEIVIDPEEQIVSVCNINYNENNNTNNSCNDKLSLVAYITIYEQTNSKDSKIKLLDRNMQKLQYGMTTNNDGITENCITFIVLCPSLTFAHLCYIDYDYTGTTNNPTTFDLNDIRIESDVQFWNQHSNPNDAIPINIKTIGFPLACGSGSTTGNTNTDNDNGFLCTQGVNGQLTHFFSGNLHAIDFRCPIGTPLLAVGNGVVIDVIDKNTLTGIAVTNLFTWNSIMIQLDNHMLFVEYVHVSKSFVKIGDHVIEGQQIGLSGSVGFSPEPHLHLAAYRSKEATAETVRVHFHSKSKLISKNSTNDDNHNGKNSNKHNNTNTGDDDNKNNNKKKMSPIQEITTSSQTEAKISVANNTTETTLLKCSGTTFLPKAGFWYNYDGLVDI